MFWKMRSWSLRLPKLVRSAGAAGAAVLNEVDAAAVRLRRGVGMGQGWALCAPLCPTRARCAHDRERSTHIRTVVSRTRTRGCATRTQGHRQTHTRAPAPAAPARRRCRRPGPAARRAGAWTASCRACALWLRGAPTDARARGGVTRRARRSGPARSPLCDELGTLARLRKSPECAGECGCAAGRSLARGRRIKGRAGRALAERAREFVQRR